MDLNKDIKDLSLNIDIATVTILYNRYKSFLLPAGIILACIILFFLVISPQIQNVLAQREQQQIEQAKLAALKNNYSLLSSMDQTELDSDFNLSTGVLPSVKDFAGIINSISTNSQAAGVSIGDFQFSVGNITKSSEGALSFPSIQINLNINGDISSIINFIERLHKSAPMSEVTSIQASNTSAVLAVRFYYKAFPQAVISDDTTIIPFTAKEKQLLSSLALWQLNTSTTSLLPISPNQASESSQLESPVASESGISPLQ